MARDYVARLVLQLKDEATPGLSRARRSVDQTSGGMGRFGQVAKTAALGFAGFAGAAITGTAKLALWGANVERGYKQLGSLVGGMDNAQAIMGVAAKATGHLANKQELLPSVMRLVNMGLIRNVGDTERVIGVTGKMAGQAAKTVPEAVDALTNAMMSGRTSGLRPFGIDSEKLNKRMDELAQQFPNMSRQERMWIAVQEQADTLLQHAGPTVWNAADALKAMKNTFIDAAADMSMKLVPALDNFARTMQGLFPVVEQAMTTVFGALVPMFEQVMGGLTLAIQKFVESGALITLIQAFGAAFQLVGTVVGKLLPILADLASALIVALGPAVIVVLNVLNTVAGIVLDALAPAFRMVGQILIALQPAFTAIATVIGTVLIVVIQALCSVFTTLLQAIAPILPLITETFVTVVMVIANALMSIITQAQTHGTLLNTIFTQAWNIIQAVITTAISIIEPLIRLFLAVIQGDWHEAWIQVSTLFSNVWNGIVSFVQTVFGNLGGAILLGIGALLLIFGTNLPVIGALWSAFWALLHLDVGGAFGFIKQAVSEGIEGVRGILSTVGGWIKQAWDFLWGGIQSVASTVWEGIKGAVDWGLGLLRGSFEFFGNLLHGVWNWIWNTLPGIAQTVWGGIQGFFSTAWSTLHGIFSNAGGILHGVWNTIWNTLSSVIGPIWNNVVIAAQGAWGWLHNIFREAGGWLSGIWNTVWNGLSSVIGPIWNSVVLAAQGAWGWLHGIFNQAGGVLSSIWNTVWNGLSGIIGPIWSGVVGAAQGAWGWLHQIFSGAGGVLSGIWSTVWNGLSGVIGFVWNGVIGAAQGAWGWLHQIFSGAGGALSGIWHGIWNGLSTVIPALWEGVKGAAGTAWEALHGIFRGAQGVLSGIWRGIWDGLGPILTTCFEGLKGVLGTALNGLTSVFSGILGGLPGILGGVLGGLPGIATGGIGLLAGAVAIGIGAIHGDWGRAWDNIKGTVSNSWPEIQGIAEKGGRLLQVGQIGIQAAMKGDWGTAWAAIQYIIEHAWPLIQEIARVGGRILGDIIKNVLQSILSGWGIDWDTAGRIIDGAWKSIKELVNGAIESVKSIIDGGMQVVRGTIGFFTDLFKGDFQGAWNHIVEITRGFMQVVDGVLNGIFTILDVTIGEALRQCGVNVDLSWGNIKRTIQWWLEEIQRKIEEVWNNVTTWLDTTWTGIKETAERIWKEVHNIIGGQLNGIIDALNVFIGGVQNAINWISEKLGLGKLIDPVMVLAKIEGLAGGGKASGGVTLVGEKGPELVMLPAGAMVYTARQTANMLNSQKGREGHTQQLGTGGLLWDDIVNTIKDLPNKVREFAANAANKVMEFIGHGVDWIVDRAFEAAHLIAPALPGIMAKWGPALWSKFKDGIKSLVHSWIDGMTGGPKAKGFHLPPMLGGGRAWREYIERYFPANQVANAVRVMMLESGGNPRAVGDHGASIGLFQIRWDFPGRPSAQQLFDPEFNVRYASQLWRAEGWRPWTAAMLLGLVPGISPSQVAGMIGGGPGGKNVTPYWGQHGYEPPVTGTISQAPSHSHKAIDIAAPTGTDVFAVANSIANVLPFMEKGFGNYIILEHLNDKFMSLYGHLNETLVRSGHYVSAGDLIGRVGSTGLSTGPHLHFEIRSGKYGGDFVATDDTLLWVGDNGPERVTIRPLSGAYANRSSDNEGNTTYNYNLEYHAIRREPGRKDAVKAMKELEFLARTGTKQR